MKKKLPALTGWQIVRALEKAGFKVVRQKGSHLRLAHPDGRKVTAPIHAGETIGRGLLSNILRDAKLSRDGCLNPLSS
ncbi:MAG: type II toxin-antitoxin system HicA family toxin [Armatimonadota bacterium]